MTDDVQMVPSDAAGVEEANGGAFDEVDSGDEEMISVAMKEHDENAGLDTDDPFATLCGLEKRESVACDVGGGEIEKVGDSTQRICPFFFLTTSTLHALQ